VQLACLCSHHVCMAIALETAAVSLLLKQLLPKPMSHWQCTFDVCMIRYSVISGLSVAESFPFSD